MEKQIGKISHFFPKISVAVIDLTDSLKVGDEIVIKSSEREVRQKVDSIQIEHENVSTAKKGQSVGVKVVESVHEGNKVFKVEE